MPCAQCRQAGCNVDVVKPKSLFRLATLQITAMDSSFIVSLSHVAVWNILKDLLSVWTDMGKS